MMNIVHKIVLIMIVSGGLVGSAYGGADEDKSALEKSVLATVAEERWKSYNSPGEQELWQQQVLMYVDTAARLTRVQKECAIQYYRGLYQSNASLLRQMRIQAGERNREVVELEIAMENARGYLKALGIDARAEEAARAAGAASREVALVTAHAEKTE
jgi:hypothetical protein